MRDPMLGVVRPGLLCPRGREEGKGRLPCRLRLRERTMTKTLRAVLFDFDGNLANSYPAVTISGARSTFLTTALPTETLQLLKGVSDALCVPSVWDADGVARQRRRSNRGVSAVWANTSGASPYGNSHAV
ncbi:MAG: hypothetical protein L0Z62_27730 [Gemmataceae bacterium]|nr:hypothetical protein [Gemmataceae bacterium]